MLFLIKVFYSAGPPITFQMLNKQYEAMTNILGSANQWTPMINTSYPDHKSIRFYFLIDLLYLLQTIDFCGQNIQNLDNLQVTLKDLQTF